MRGSICSWLFFFLALCSTAAGAQESLLQPADPAENSPREDLRSALFKNEINTRSCITIDAGPKGGLLKDAPDLDQFLKELILALQKGRHREVAAKFHPRLKVHESLIKEQFAAFERTYASPLDFSIYKLWAINTVDGTTTGFNCMEGLQVHPQYGYPLQFGLWLQLMGQKELARLYIPIVPLRTKDRWALGGLHIQQWTHHGKDFSAWLEFAQSASQDKHPIAAYIGYDIATKLLNGGGMLTYASVEYIQELQAKVMPKSEFEATILAHVRGQIQEELKPIYVASILTEDGAGVLVRFSTPRDLTLEEVTQNCANVGRNMVKSKWDRHLAGIKCTYVLPKEDPTKEGVLGGLYMSFKKLPAPTPKKH